MTKNPFINALAAALYISIVASVMYYGPQLAGRVESFFFPIAVFAVSPLSAAIMGYLFLSQPLRLYFDGAKQEATKLFLQTVAVFALITILILLALFSIKFF